MMKKLLDSGLLLQVQYASLLPFSSRARLSASRTAGPRNDLVLAAESWKTLFFFVSDLSCSRHFSFIRSKDLASQKTPLYASMHLVVYQVLTSSIFCKH